MSNKYNLDTFVVGEENLSLSDNGQPIHTELGHFGAIDETISAMEALEQMRYSKSLEEKKQYIMEQDQSVEERQYLNPLITKRGNIHHLYLNETGIIFSEYMKKLFTYLNKLDEDVTVKVFFYASLFESEKDEFVYITSLMSALDNCSAHTIAMCYSFMGFVPTIIASHCDDIAVGDFCNITLEYPKIEDWGGYKVYQTVLDSIYNRFLTRGIVSQEEYDTITEDHTKVICIDSKKLKERI
jgi:hypothetical protein